MHHASLSELPSFRRCSGLRRPKFSPESLKSPFFEHLPVLHGNNLLFGAVPTGEADDALVPFRLGIHRISDRCFRHSLQVWFRSGTRAAVLDGCIQVFLKALFTRQWTHIGKNRTSIAPPPPISPSESSGTAAQYDQMVSARRLREKS